MLKIHVLNVSHGDSIVLEYVPEDEASPHQFALIDCNVRGDANPALDFLRAKGAVELQFVALTHPHEDHYAGLGDICDEFSGKINGFFTFPIELDQDQLKKFLGKYVENGLTLIESNARAARDLTKFVIAAWNNQKKWDTPTASLPAPMRVPGFKGVDFYALLPSAGVRGRVMNRLLEGQLTTQASDLNDLSLVILVSYGGKQVILGADGTVVSWNGVAAKWEDDRSLVVNPVAVKLPHHGSQKDCAPVVLKHFFGKKQQNVTEDECNDERFAIISASGSTHHPHTTVLTSLAEMGIKPYCTNLSERCGGLAQHVLTARNSDVSPELLRVLETFSEEPGRERPCQGNITLTIDRTGVVSVQTQHVVPCGFRGGWGPLVAMSQTIQ